MINNLENQATLMVTCVIVQAYWLKPEKRKLFVEWLCAHGGQVNQGYELYRMRDSLVDWFESLSETEALREYGLVIGEIKWWHDLKEEALHMLLDKQNARADVQPIDC